MPGNGGIHISNIFPAWADMSGSNLAKPRYALRTAPCRSFHPSKRIVQVQVPLYQISVRSQYLFLSPCVCLIWKKRSGESPKHPQLGHPPLSPGTGTVGWSSPGNVAGGPRKRDAGCVSRLGWISKPLRIFSACCWSSTGTQKLSTRLSFTPVRYPASLPGLLGYSPIAPEPLAAPLSWMPGDP